MMITINRLDQVQLATCFTPEHSKYYLPIYITCLGWQRFRKFVKMLMKYMKNIPLYPDSSLYVGEYDPKPNVNSDPWRPA